MPRPTRRPLGITLTQTAKDISRAFDDALAAAGSSRPVWLVLLSLKARPTSNQSELAETLGIRGATLTHHLNAMEAGGLLHRHRDPSNRRVHIVELTDDGDALFHRLRTAATAFDKQLRGDLTEDDLAQFERILAQLHDNVTNVDTPT